MTKMIASLPDLPVSFSQDIFLEKETAPKRNEKISEKGGPGSGNWGHQGLAGVWGGSSPTKTATSWDKRGYAVVDSYQAAVALQPQDADVHGLSYTILPNDKLLVSRYSEEEHTVILLQYLEDNDVDWATNEEIEEFAENYNRYSMQFGSVPFLIPPSLGKKLVRVKVYPDWIDFTTQRIDRSSLKKIQSLIEKGKMPLDLDKEVSWNTYQSWNQYVDIYTDEQSGSLSGGFTIEDLMNARGIVVDRSNPYAPQGATPFALKEISLKGGPGSGNWGHSGLEGVWGGSSPTKSVNRFATPDDFEFSKQAERHMDYSFSEFEKEYQYPEWWEKDDEPIEHQISFIDVNGWVCLTYPHNYVVEYLRRDTRNEIKNMGDLLNKTGLIRLIPSIVEDGGIQVSRKGVTENQVKVLSKIAKNLGYDSRNINYSITDFDGKEIVFGYGVQNLLDDLKELKLETTKGGPGSGNWGHSGLEGVWGGSSPKNELPDLPFSIEDMPYIKQTFEEVYNGDKPVISNNLPPSKYMDSTSYIITPDGQVVHSPIDSEKTATHTMLFSYLGVSGFEPMLTEDEQSLTFDGLTVPEDERVEEIFFDRGYISVLMISDQYAFGDVVGENPITDIFIKTNDSINRRLVQKIARLREKGLFSDVGDDVNFIIYNMKGNGTTEFKFGEIDSIVGFRRMPSGLEPVYKEVSKKGGKGSGNWGHGGLEGVWGGSTPKSPLDLPYGGLPSGGGFDNWTEYEIGHQRFCEAGHCILGSLVKMKKGNPKVVEAGHILEELGIMRNVIEEYSRDIYTRDVTPDRAKSIKSASRELLKTVDEMQAKLGKPTDEVERLAESTYNVLRVFVLQTKINSSLASSGYPLLNVFRNGSLKHSFDDFEKDVEDFLSEIVTTKGGQGSGNWGHGGLAGTWGGSSPTKTASWRDNYSKEFWQWFGDSKVKDVDGKPKVMYHQTSESAEREIMEEGFDINTVGARRSDPAVPDGFFFKPTPNDISVGAYGEESVQIPVYLKAENPLVVDSREELLSILGEDDAYLNFYYEADRIDRKVAADFDALEKEYWKAPRSEQRKKHEMQNEILEKGKIRYNRVCASARARARQILKNLGHDSVLIRRDVGSFNRNVMTYIVFDPNQIKSIYTYKPTDSPLITKETDIFKNNLKEIFGRKLNDKIEPPKEVKDTRFKSYMKALVIDKMIEWQEKGGAGSGNWGHQGLAGVHGGSSPTKNIDVTDKLEVAFRRNAGVTGSSAPRIDPTIDFSGIPQLAAWITPSGEIYGAKSRDNALEFHHTQVALDILERAGIDKKFGVISYMIDKGFVRVGVSKDIFYVDAKLPMSPEAHKLTMKIFREMQPPSHASWTSMFYKNEEETIVARSYGETKWYLERNSLEKTAPGVTAYREVSTKGGVGSGNWGHQGLDGVWGGSSPTKNIDMPISFEEGVTGRKKMVIDAAREAFDIAREVHGDIKGLSKIEIVNAKFRSPRARCIIENVGRNLAVTKIEFGTSCKEEEATIATALHEYGHWLEQSKFDVIQSTMPEKNYDEFVEKMAVYKKIGEAIRNSNEYKILEKIKKGELKSNITNWEYFKKPEELFARAYYQYIVMKSKAPILASYRNYFDKSRGSVINEVNGKLSVTFNTQWEKNDFAPISEAFDSFFKMIKGG